MTRTQTPLGALGRGLLAGVAGTAAMDLARFAGYKRSGGDDRLVDWEFSAGLKDWDGAPAPAQVGRRVVEGLFQRPLPAETAAFTNNVTHWGYGVAWGAVFGLVAGSLPSTRLRHGLALGPIVWASGYVVLPLAKLYKPMWEYDVRTLAPDLAAHTVYGLATAAAFRALTRP